MVYCYLGGDHPDCPDDDEEVAYYSDEDGEQDQVLSEYMTLMFHEMLRKTRQGNTSERQSNTTQLTEKLDASGGTQTQF